MNKRNIEIYEFHREGKTQRWIADKFNISNSRVNQICEEVKRWNELVQERDNDPLFKLLQNQRIPKRVYQALMRAGYGRDFDIDWLIDDLRNGASKLIGFNGLGVNGIESLKTILIRRDFTLEEVPPITEYDPTTFRISYEENKE